MYSSCSVFVCIFDLVLVIFLLLWENTVTKLNLFMEERVCFVLQFQGFRVYNRGEGMEAEACHRRKETVDHIFHRHTGNRKWAGLSTLEA